MRHYAAHGEIGLTTFVREVKFKISFCPRAMACAALYPEGFTVRGVFLVDGWASHEAFSTKSSKIEVRSAGRHGNKQLLKALLRARHTHALAGVECRTHPWSAWVGLGASISIYVPHLSRGACSGRPHVYVYERPCLPYGRSRVFD